MLKLGRVTKFKMLFLVLVFVFNFDLFKFSAAILEQGLLIRTMAARRCFSLLGYIKGTEQNTKQSTSKDKEASTTTRCEDSEPKAKQAKKERAFKEAWRKEFSLDVSTVDHLMNISLNGPSPEEFVAEKAIIHWVQESQRARRPNFLD